MVNGIFRHPEQVFEFMTVRRREREREEKKSTIILENMSIVSEGSAATHVLDVTHTHTHTHTHTAVLFLFLFVTFLENDEMI